MGAVAAHVQLARYRSVFGRILREEAHPIGCCETKPLRERSIFNNRGAAASAKDPRGYCDSCLEAHTRCRGGTRPLDMGDWYGVCAAFWLCGQLFTSKLNFDL